MTAASVRVVGEARALALAGPPAGGTEAASPAVHLGAPGAEPAAGDVVWLPGPAAAAPAEAAPAGPPGAAPAGPAAAAPPPAAAAPPTTRVIATSGDGLWSRAPWPASDALFDMPPAAEPAALVVCPDAERRAHVADALAARGLRVHAAAELTLEDLTGASAVALLGSADAATPDAPWAAEALPAEAPAVLAAGRLLAAPRCATAFGFLAGTDHLAFGTQDDVANYLDAALTHPPAFEPFGPLGRIAAERHRASVVFARLAAELAPA